MFVPFKPRNYHQLRLYIAAADTGAQTLNPRRAKRCDPGVFRLAQHLWGTQSCIIWSNIRHTPSFMLCVRPGLTVAQMFAFISKIASILVSVIVFYSPSASNNRRFRLSIGARIKTAQLAVSLHSGARQVRRQGPPGIIPRTRCGCLIRVLHDARD